MVLVFFVDSIVYVLIAVLEKKFHLHFSRDRKLNLKEFKKREAREVDVSDFTSDHLC